MTSKPKKLLNCPHCGEVAKLYRAEDGTYSVSCSNLYCFVKTTFWRTEEAAIGVWNRRVGDDTSQWSKEKPTEIGWYCLWNAWMSQVCSVWVFDRNGKLWATINGRAPVRLKNVATDLLWLKLHVPR